MLRAVAECLMSFDTPENVVKNYKPSFKCTNHLKLSMLQVVEVLIYHNLMVCRDWEGNRATIYSQGLFKVPCDFLFCSLKCFCIWSNVACLKLASSALYVVRVIFRSIQCSLAT